MKGNKLIVLFGVFILAVVIHTIYFGREYFTVPQTRTPLTKENVQALVDEVAMTYYDLYKKYRGMKSSDPRVTYRLELLSKKLLRINDEYPSIRYTINNIKYTDYPGIALEDLQIVKQYVTYSVGNSGLLSGVKPADLLDLDQFSNRTLSFVSFITDKANVAHIELPSPFKQEEVQLLLTNIANLKKNFSNMKLEDIPLLKDDLYLIVYIIGLGNFSKISPQPPFELFPETLELPNFPFPKTSLQALASSIIPTTTTPAPPATPAAPAAPVAPIAANTTSTPPAPVGYKFSELVGMLLTYSPFSKTDGKPQRQEKQLTSTAADLLNTQYAAPGTAGSTVMTSNVFMEQIRTVVRDELKGIKVGPKDAVNKDLAERATEVVKNGASGACTKKVSTDSLEQGKWFRTATDASCPYANGQQMAESSDPVPPFNMNDYIRKDSIPCWACNLK